MSSNKKNVIEISGRNELLNHVHAYHKNLSWDYLNSLKNWELLSLSHPNDYAYHQRRLQEKEEPSV